MDFEFGLFKKYLIVLFTLLAISNCMPTENIIMNSEQNDTSSTETSDSLRRIDSTYDQFENNFKTADSIMTPQNSTDNSNDSNYFFNY